MPESWLCLKVIFYSRSSFFFTSDVDDAMRDMCNDWCQQCLASFPICFYMYLVYNFIIIIITIIILIIITRKRGNCAALQLEASRFAACLPQRPLAEKLSCPKTALGPV